MLLMLTSTRYLGLAISLFLLFKMSYTTRMEPRPLVRVNDWLFILSRGKVIVAANIFRQEDRLGDVSGYMDVQQQGCSCLGFDYYTNNSALVEKENKNEVMWGDWRLSRWISLQKTMSVIREKLIQLIPCKHQGNFIW